MHVCCMFSRSCRKYVGALTLNERDLLPMVPAVNVSNPKKRHRVHSRQIYQNCLSSSDLGTMVAARRSHFACCHLVRFLLNLRSASSCSLFGLNVFLLGHLGPKPVCEPHCSQVLLLFIISTRGHLLSIGGCSNPIFRASSQSYCILPKTHQLHVSHHLGFGYKCNVTFVSVRCLCLAQARLPHT